MDEPIQTISQFFDERNEQKEEKDRVRAQTLFEFMLDLLNARDCTRVAGRGYRFRIDAKAFLSAAERHGIHEPLIAAEDDIVERQLSYGFKDAPLVAIDGSAQFDVLVGYGSNAIAAHMLGMRGVRNDLFHGVLCNYLGWNGIEDAAGSLAPKGRAAYAVPTVALGGYSDIFARQYLLERGLIEAVVELNVSFTDSGSRAPLSVIVLSRGNDEVAFVDATSYASLDGIKLEGAQHISTSTIIENSSILRPSLWKDGVCLRRFEPLGSLATRISRGTTMKAEELKETRKGILIGEGNEIWYLAVAALDKRTILGEVFADGAGDLCGELPPNQQRYLVKEGDIVINKMRPFTVAMIRTGEARKCVLPSGNLFSVTLDAKKVIPEFVLAFLMSEDGYFQLFDGALQRTTPSITRQCLEQIMIPVDTMEVQRAVVDELFRMRCDYYDLEDRVFDIKLRCSFLAV